MASEQILEKLRRLLKLAESPNPNEAETARKLANNLIEKYHLGAEDVESIKDKKPLYGEAEKLFQTTEFVFWKSLLALAIADKFDVHVVQEEASSDEGVRFYEYYVLGEPEDIQKTKLVFQCLDNKVEELIRVRCVRRGLVFTDSYAEGLIQGIKNNLEFVDIQFSMDHKAQDAAEAIVKPSTAEAKEIPITNKTTISSDNRVKDMRAYYMGIFDGQNTDIRAPVDKKLEAHKLMLSEHSSKE